MMKKTLRFMLIILVALIFIIPLTAEEGMFPLSEIPKLDIHSIGLQIDPSELYNPDGVSLIDGIINLSGCTASFVSPDGLILTNYHCAFNAVQMAATTQNDYLRDGFIATDRKQEIPAKGYTVRVIHSYKDVSAEVLSVIKPKMSYIQRAKAIDKKMKDIVTGIESKDKGKRAEVAEMFPGKTYVLFVYTYLKDVRLVYAPPRSIGEFGGEIDNWVWPRHTGDFTFLRAYTAPDGTNAEYAPGNVPYHPKKFLQVASEGVKEEDLVFILGYPGTTNRHKTSLFLNYEQNVRMPFIDDLYGWLIHTLEQRSTVDRSIEIKLSSRLKGLWNTYKRTQGVLQALKAIKLDEKRKEEELALQKFIDSVPARKAKYGTVLPKIAELYGKKALRGPHDMLLYYLLRNTTLLNNAYVAYEASIERKKKDTDREARYMDRSFDKTKEDLELNLKNYDETSDKTILKGMLLRAAALDEQHRIPAVDKIFTLDPDKEKAVDIFIEKAYGTSKLNDKEYLKSLFDKTTLELSKLEDPFMELAINLYPSYQERRDSDKAETGVLDELLALYIDAKKEFAGSDFIPDANSTLRFTYGHVRGYSPADAVYMKPFTTLSGVMEKNTGKEPFEAPSKLIELYNNKDFGKAWNPILKDVPVNFLYNMDTTGGNSGSPVFNAKGQLVGLNFDRVFRATINDFAWNESYSRSIGVDIRYIIWFLEKFGGAGQLLKEMNL